MTSKSYRAKVVLVVLVTLIAALLACGGPHNADLLGTSGQNGGPYWACATATPIPTENWVEQVTVTPGVVETIVHQTTPVPTETPYYRYGEFHLGQSAVIGAMQVTLTRAETSGAYGLVTFQIKNNSGTESAFALSTIVFISDANGQPVNYDHAAQLELGLGNPSDIESEPVAPHEAREQTLAFAGGLPGQVGFKVNLTASSPPPIWFLTGADPVPCPYGQAQWPVPMRGGQVGARPNSSVIGQTPLGNAPYRLTSPFGCSDWGSGSAGHCDRSLDYDNDGIPDTLLHHGLDLAVGQGTPLYSPLKGIVTFSGWSTAGYGHLLVVRAPIGGGDYVWMYFAHQMQPALVGEGQSVSCGQNIGFVGTTGNSTGPHLHWELRKGALASGPFGANNIDPDGSRAAWEFVCESTGIPYLNECRAEGAC